jgi:hypothetical protein
MLTIPDAIRGPDAATLADWCQVSEQTARRWQTGNRPIPAPALALAELHYHGRVIPVDWKYLRVTPDGRLALGADLALSEAEVFALPGHVDLLRSLQYAARQEADRLGAELAAERRRCRGRWPSAGVAG